MPPYLSRVTSILLPAILVAYGFAFAQDPKGLKPVIDKTPVKEGITRALVVGISEYEYIDKLQFAHRDAEIFTDYLVTQNVRRSDISLLTNKNAKRGTIITELLRIAQLSKPGDKLIFYFSGHGDVENFTLMKKGYLLTYDTYSNNYMAGALAVNDLKDIFVTLCRDTVKVIVITDACRSGKLSGGKEGTQYTAQLLKELWSNEIKMLSSEPNELSVEGSEWGNGRGLFSYYLVNGLKGDADNNKDSLITINELNKYVGDHVAEITKNRQQPSIVGPGKYSTVVADLRVNARSKIYPHSGDAVFLKPWYWVPADSCEYYYRKVDEAISTKNFKPGDPSSAVSFYQQLKRCSKDNELVYSANSKLLSAMMNDAQDIVNNTFIGKKYVERSEYNYAIGLFDEILKNNDLKLPYEKPLTNLKRYLTVMEKTLWDFRYGDTLLERILDSALAEEPGAPYLLSVKGLFELRKGNYTRAIEILEEATRLAPGWLIPKYYLGICYGYKREFKKALDYYQEVLNKDPEAKTFDCAKCIEEKISEYQKRVSRIRFEKFNTSKFAELDSIRKNLADNIDSADFYHQMGNLSNKRNHPKRDSVYYYFTQAVTLDPWEIDYMYSLLDYLEKELYGGEEIRQWILTYLKARDKQDYIDDYDDVYLNEYLLFSYISSKQLNEAKTILSRLVEGGFYDCSKLKKLRKHLSKLENYTQLTLDCDK